MTDLSQLFAITDHDRVRQVLCSTHLENSEESLASIYSGTQALDLTLYENLCARSIDDHGNSIEEFHRHHDTLFHQSNYPKHISFHRNKVITSLRIISLMEDLIGERLAFKRHLDICCAAGIMGATMKYLGASEETVGIDIVDRSNDIVDRSNDIKASCYEIVDTVIRSTKKFDFSSPEVLRGRHDHGYSCNQPIWSNTLNSAYDCKSLGGNISCLQNDKYIVGDFLLTDIENTFDFITLYAGLDYFRTEDIFEKIGRLLTSGGYFYTANSYFWEIAGSTMNLPQFPWLHTCLSKERYLQVVEELYGCGARDVVAKMYYFADTFVTASLQQEYADKYGLQLVYQRRVPFKNMAWHDPIIFSKITKYIIDTRPEIKINPLDLDTHVLLQVYKKI